MGDVEAVGHQHPGRDRRHAQPGTQLTGRELGDLRSPRAADPPRPLPARPGRLLGVETVSVVQVGVLDRDPHSLDLEPVPRGGQDLGLVEQRPTP